MAFAARYHTAPAPADDRREPRTQVRLDARGEGGALLIHDLSTRGFLAVVDGPPPADEHVTVDLPGLGPVGARIAWRGEGCFGGEFASTLSRQELAAVLAKARVVWADFAESRGHVAALAARAETLPGGEPAWDDLAPPPVPAPEAPLPHDDRFALHTRLRIILAGAIAAWLLLVALVFALFG